MYVIKLNVHNRTTYIYLYIWFNYKTIYYKTIKLYTLNNMYIKQCVCVCVCANYIHVNYIYIYITAVYGCHYLTWWDCDRLLYRGKEKDT